MRALLNTLTTVLFVVAMPLALVLTNVRLMAFDPAYYLRGYERNGVAQSTGMTREQLAEAVSQIQAYFRGGPSVSVVIEKEWSREPLFNAREQQHLADVRDFLWLALRVQEVSLAYVLAAVVAWFIFFRPLRVEAVAHRVSAAAGLTLTLFVGLGVLAIGDFQSFWTRFHLLSFTNDLWLLDPRTDYMIRMHPAPFWFEAIVELVVRSAGVAAVLLLLAQGFLRWPRRAPITPARNAQVAR